MKKGEEYTVNLGIPSGAILSQSNRTTSSISQPDQALTKNNIFNSRIDNLNKAIQIILKSVT